MLQTVGRRCLSTRHLLKSTGEAVPIPCRLDKFLHDGARKSLQDLTNAWIQGRVTVKGQKRFRSADGLEFEHVGNTGKFMSDIFIFPDDEVTLDGAPVQFRDPGEVPRCFALHKPAGVSMEQAFSSKEIKRRQHERARVAHMQRTGQKDFSISRPSGALASLLEKIPQGFFPVGRLDADTTGLLLLTDCGDFSNYLTTPGKYIKEYECEIVRKYLQSRDQPRVEQLLKGIELREHRGHSHEREPAKACYVKQVGHDTEATENANTWKLIMGISEGRYRVVRRMLGAVGLSLGNLHRVKVGSVDINELGLLKPGAIKELPAVQVEELWGSDQTDETVSTLRTAQERVIEGKLRALTNHLEHLRKVGHPNSRLQMWIDEHAPPPLPTTATKHLERMS